MSYCKSKSVLPLLVMFKTPWKKPPLFLYFETDEKLRELVSNKYTLFSKLIQILVTLKKSLVYNFNSGNKAMYFYCSIECNIADQNGKQYTYSVVKKYAQMAGRSCILL